MKIFVNKCFGGIRFSPYALERLKEMNISSDDLYGISRDDARAISIIEELGDRASGNLSKIKVVNIPDSATDWTVWDYDGVESVIYVQDGKLHFS